MCYSTGTFPITVSVVCFKKGHVGWKSQPLELKKLPSDLAYDELKD